MTHLMGKWKEPEHYKVILKIAGDVLHRDYWDKKCCYTKETYHFFIKSIFGKEKSTDMTISASADFFLT
jgi:hypothetical protein